MTKSAAYATLFAANVPVIPMPPKLCLNVASTVDLPACVSTNGILYLVHWLQTK